MTLGTPRNRTTSSLDEAPFRSFSEPSDVVDPSGKTTVKGTMVWHNSSPVGCLPTDAVCRVVFRDGVFHIHPINDPTPTQSLTEKAVSVVTTSSQPSRDSSTPASQVSMLSFTPAPVSTGVSTKDEEEPTNGCNQENLELIFGGIPGERMAIPTAPMSAFASSPIAYPNLAEMFGDTSRHVAPASSGVVELMAALAASAAAPVLPVRSTASPSNPPPYAPGTFPALSNTDPVVVTASSLSNASVRPAPEASRPLASPLSIPASAPELSKAEAEALLLKCWPAMRNALILQGASWFHLPVKDVSAFRIRQYLMDPSRTHLWKITSLNLSGLGLDHLPSELKYFSGLTELNLSNNQFTMLSPELFGPLSSRIQKLNLANNNIKRIPDVSFLPALKELVLSGNKIGSLVGLPKEGDFSICVANNPVMSMLCSSYFYSSLGKGWLDLEAARKAQAYRAHGELGKLCHDILFATVTDEDLVKIFKRLQDNWKTGIYAALQQEAIKDKTIKWSQGDDPKKATDAASWGQAYLNRNGIFDQHRLLGVALMTFVDTWSYHTSNSVKYYKEHGFDKKLQQLSGGLSKPPMPYPNAAMLADVCCGYPQVQAQTTMTPVDVTMGVTAPEDTVSEPMDLTVTYNTGYGNAIALFGRGTVLIDGKLIELSWKGGLKLDWSEGNQWKGSFAVVSPLEFVVCRVDDKGRLMEQDAQLYRSKPDMKILPNLQWRPYY